MILFNTAVGLNRYDVVLKLLKETDVTAFQINYGIRIACVKGYLRMLKLLISYGIDDIRISKYNNYCLNISNLHGHKDCLKVLVRDSIKDIGKLNTIKNLKSLKINYKEYV